MAKSIDAHRLIKSLIGRTIETYRRSPNTILIIENDSVIVGTKSSPAGEPVPVECVREAVELLVTEGEVPLQYAPLGCYRGSFFLAILLSLPGVARKANPSRAVVTDRDTLERFLYAEGVSKPSPTEFKAMAKTARQQARRAGLKKSDLAAAIRKVRK